VRGERSLDQSSLVEHGSSSEQESLEQSLVFAHRAKVATVKRGISSTSRLGLSVAAKEGGAAGLDKEGSHSVPSSHHNEKNTMMQQASSAHSSSSKGRSRSSHSQQERVTHGISTDGYSGGQSLQPPEGYSRFLETQSRLPASENPYTLETVRTVEASFRSGGSSGVSSTVKSSVISKFNKALQQD
jgi:hypothetical protein